GGECANVCDETNDTCNLPAGTPCTPANDPCIDDVCDGNGTCGVDTCLDNFSGILKDVPIASITGSGWTQCYIDAYGNAGTSLSSILSACSQARLLMGCRNTGSPTLHLAANANRADVLFDTGMSNTPHNANGVGWYYNDSFSWGFAPQGD